MYSLIAFLFALAEIVAIAVSYAMHFQAVFANVVVYGSPFYMIMHLLSSDSAIMEKNPIYLLFAAFHLIKYFAFFQAQIKEDGGFLRTGAILMEALYLAASAYYSL